MMWSNPKREQDLNALSNKPLRRDGLRVGLNVSTLPCRVSKAQDRVVNSSLDFSM